MVALVVALVGSLITLGLLILVPEHRSVEIAASVSFWIGAILADDIVMLDLPSFPGGERIENGNCSDGH